MSNADSVALGDASYLSRSRDTVAGGHRDTRTRARILLVAPQPFFTLRGTPLNVLRMARVLCDAGHDVHLATYPLGATIAVPGLTYHRACGVPGVRHVGIGFSRRKLLLDASLALRVWQLQLTHRFDVVHAVEESVFLALPLAAIRRTPLIYDVDSVLSEQLRYSGAVRSRPLLAAVRALERASLRRSAATITVCSALTDAVRALEPGARVVQIEDCPLPESAREPDVRAVSALRQQLGLTGKPVAVYLGNFEPYQGVDLLLEAWRLVARRLPNARLVVVGGDHRGVETLRAAVAADPPAAASIVWLGSQPPARLPELMALGHALVSPRRLGENTPLKLYSYMASGIPIVATALRTHTQVLDASTAVLAEPDARAFAGALSDVLADPARYRALGVAARALAAARYSEQAFARKLLEAYEQLLAASVSEPAR